MNDVKLSDIVSRETEEKLLEYIEILLKWNQRINLVSKNLNNNLLMHHIIDSLDLSSLLMKNNVNSKVIDIGSGAGLPGIILAILGIKGIYLIESIRKKAIFLEYVKDKLKLDAEIINKRVEDIKNLRADVIVSKGMTSCKKLIELSEAIAHNNTKFFIMKTKNQFEEITEVEKYWDFKLKIHQNNYIVNNIVLEFIEVKKK
jgi:16S rRNA (guanine527-N7)-methyltransferase